MQESEASKPASKDKQENRKSGEVNKQESKQSKTAN